MVEPAGIDDRARGAQGTTERVGERLDDFRELLGIADTAAARNDHVRLCEIDTCRCGDLDLDELRDSAQVSRECFRAAVARTFVGRTCSGLHRSNRLA